MRGRSLTSPHHLHLCPLFLSQPCSPSLLSTSITSASTCTLSAATNCPTKRLAHRHISPSRATSIISLCFVPRSFSLSSLGNFLPILRAFSCTMSLLVNHPSPRIMTERRLQAFSSTANHLKISKDLPQDLQDIYCASVQSSLPQVQVSASSGVHQQTVNCSLQVRAKTVEVICQKFKLV